jgi:hypothetical protein
MLPPPPPVTGQTPGLPQGITINIGHPGQAQQPPQPMDPQAYLQPATQQPRPSLQDHQKQFAGDLLSAGFDQDVIDQVWQQNTGRGLGG